MSTDGRDTVSNLVLVRLLGARDKTLGLKKLKQDLSQIVQAYMGGEEWDLKLGEALEALLTQNLIQETKVRAYRLTEAGVRAATSYLGADYFPKRIDWRTIKDQYLVARSLGLTISSAKDLKKVKADNIRAQVVKKALGLDLPDLPTPVRTMGSASWRALGKETSDPLTLGAVRAHLLNQLLGTTRALDEEQAFKLLAAKHAGARNTNANALRKALLERLVKPLAETLKTPVASQPEGNVGEFARKVLKVAAATPTGRHGPEKVFISHVWKHWQSLGSAPGMTIREFKQRLIEAHRANVLTLGEADLPDQLDRSDVEESVIPYLNAKFHFIRLKRGQ